MERAHDTATRARCQQTTPRDTELLFVAALNTARPPAAIRARTARVLMPDWAFFWRERLRIRHTGALTGSLDRSSLGIPQLVGIARPLLDMPDGIFHRTRCHRRGMRRYMPRAHSHLARRGRSRIHHRRCYTGTLRP